MTEQKIQLRNRNHNVPEHLNVLIIVIEQHTIHFFYKHLFNFYTR
jgi:hypothetical protein